MELNGLVLRLFLEVLGLGAPQSVRLGLGAFDYYNRPYTLPLARWVGPRRVVDIPNYIHFPVGHKL